MSAVAMATAAPQRRTEAPTRHIEPAPRHIEIVPTRSQRKARPRAIYALVTVAGLFAILIAQLLLSIVVSDGAYQISGLQQQQKELSRDQQSIIEQLQVLRSPQHLAANAVALGMVGTSSMAYLRLSDGAVLGAPVAAQASDAIKFGAGGAALIPNKLLTGVPVVAATGAQVGTSTTGAPGTIAATGSVPSTPVGLPSPVTR